MMAGLDRAAVVERFIVRKPWSAPEIGVPGDEAEP